MIDGESTESEKRYSPAECVGCRKERVIGNPDKKLVSTSFERSNLSMRMGMRRFTRLTNAFSKKLENHTAAVSLCIISTISSATTRRYGSRLQWQLG